ncbi:MAG TPA: TspO/MBR family protein [Candidatus Paceibacterota bacterium]|nr:TspO/MBR family protein [Candidatus Paceibacterota bacterium]
MRAKDLLTAIGWVLVCEGAGLIGTIFTAPSIPSWYATLVRPTLAPPNWIFAPVWTTLFFLMGIAAFLVARAGADRRYVRAALVIFFIQLALNVGWSFLFFGLKSPAMAALEIVLLWLAIAASIWAFARVSRAAAWLLLPYIAWVTFAAYLNVAIWLLN